VALALCGSACQEDVDSIDVKTSGVYAEMGVLATGNGSSEVTADLRVGGSSSNTHLDLKGEDELRAAAGSPDTAKRMSQNGFVYEASFGVEAGDTMFTVMFKRGADDVSAPNSNVTLPDPFQLSGISSGMQISRAQGFTLTWETSPKNDPMIWNMQGDCFFHGSESTSDTGQLIVATSDFSMHSGQEQGTCNATICLERTRSGQIDANYGEGGVIKATQRRCMSFVTAP
jgi:hypothetical protein